jgi:hypothetical protein
VGVGCCCWVLFLTCSIHETRDAAAATSMPVHLGVCCLHMDLMGRFCAARLALRPAFEASLHDLYPDVCFQWSHVVLAAHTCSLLSLSSWLPRTRGAQEGSSSGLRSWAAIGAGCPGAGSPVPVRLVCKLTFTASCLTCHHPEPPHFEELDAAP